MCALHQWRSSPRFRLPGTRSVRTSPDRACRDLLEIGLAIVILVLAALVPLAVQGQVIPGTSWVEVAEQAGPAVVVIQTDAGQGSGFIVRADGTLVTNSHVLRDAQTVRVLLPNGEVFQQLHVLATDPSKDLTIARIDAVDLPYLVLGNSNDCRPGQEVLAIGAPIGMDQTVSTGIISSVRILDSGIKVLQTTAPASPGNSGGPLIDSSGAVVGVITFSLIKGQNLNFAIPSNYVRGMLQSLENGIPTSTRVIAAPIDASLSNPLTQQEPRAGVLLTGYGSPGESFRYAHVELLDFLTLGGVHMRNKPRAAGDEHSLTYAIDRLRDSNAEFLLFMKVSDELNAVGRIEISCVDAKGSLLWTEKVQKTFTWASSSAVRPMVNKMKKKLKNRLGKHGLLLVSR